MRYDVDVDNQYVAISTLWTLTTPVPWSTTCERIAAFAAQRDAHEPLNKLHCYHYQRPPQMHQYRDIQHVHLHDLDHLKTPEPPEKLMSVQHLKIFKQKSI
jgi:hypothetical protein